MRDTVAALLFTDVAVLAEHHFFNFGDGVHRSDEPARELGGEHRKIVEVITAGDDFVRLDVETTCDLGEGSAFVVSFVAEAGVDVVAHDDKVADFFAGDLEVIVNLLGILNFFGNEAERRIWILIDLRFVARVDPFCNAGHMRTDFLEEFGVELRATIVPIANADISAFLEFVNFAFHDHNEIWANAQTCFGERFHEAGEIPAGVDDPTGASLLEGADQSFEFLRHGGILKIRV